jgi:quercetin dioxygenase-like cupin family protein
MPATVDLTVPLFGLATRSPLPPPGGHGEVYRAEVWAERGGNAGPMHIHAEQEERFELVEGRITVRRGRERIQLDAGDSVAIPPGTPHTFENSGDAVAHLFTEFRPALRVQEFFAQLFGLANDDKMNAKGLVRPLQAAVLMSEFPREFFYAPYVPVPAQRALAAPLAAIARRRGYLGRYPKYEALLAADAQQGR